MFVILMAERKKGRADRVHIHGQRFDAYLSANRKRADIKDLETGSIILLLDLGDIEELAVIAADAQAGLSWKDVPTSRFRPSGHPDRDGIDLLDIRDRRRFGSLKRQALEELQLLAIELIDMMMGRR